MFSNLKIKIQNYLENNFNVHMQEVITGAILAYGLKISGAVLAFVFNVAIARLLGAEGAGVYFLALSIVTITSVIARVGLDNTLLRFVSTHNANKEFNHVNAVVILGIKITLVTTFVLSIIIFISAPVLANVVFDKEQLILPLRWMSFAIIPFSLLNLFAESLKGVKKIKFAMLTQGVGIPLLGLIFIYPLARLYGLTVNFRQKNIPINDTNKVAKT